MGGTEPRSDDEVLVVGAGFAAAAAVEFLTAAGVAVTVVDPNGYLLFTPLLYRVALGDLDPAHVVTPITMLRRGLGQVRVWRAKVDEIDTAAHVIHAAGSAIPFERMVIATGGTPTRRGVNGPEEGPMALSGLGETLRLRERLLAAMEERSEVIIVGAGPTGVELAGPLAQRGARVTIVQATPAPLPAMSRAAREHAALKLRQVGVQLEMGRLVVLADEHRVRLDDGRELTSFAVIWATGLKGRALPGLPATQDGQIKCAPDLSVIPGVLYVAGDVAAPPGRRLPMLASVAVQQGRHAARCLLASVAGQPGLPFSFVDHGRVAYITHGSAVLEHGGMSLAGPAAWTFADAAHRLLRRFPTATCDSFSPLLLRREARQR